MKFFGRKDKGNAEVAWTPKREEELQQGEADMAGLMQRLKDPGAGALGQRLAAGLRQRAVERFVEVLDEVLQTCEIGHQSRPFEAPLADFGTLSFALDGAAVRFRVELQPGKLVERQAVLAYDQGLWSGGEANSLAILLVGVAGGPPLVATGPGVAGEGLEWVASRAELIGAAYRPRLECFAAPSERRYAYGLAAGADLGASASPAPETDEPTPEGPVAVFSQQEGEAGRLVIGIECRVGGPEGHDFAAFERDLSGLLEEVGNFSVISRFPTSGRIYLALEPALQKRVQAAVEQLNRQLTERD